MEGIRMFTIKVTDINGNNHQWIGSGTESVLDGAQRNGVKIPNACKGGGCGLCKVKVEYGEFERGVVQWLYYQTMKGPLIIHSLAKPFQKGIWRLI